MLLRGFLAGLGVFYINHLSQSLSESGSHLDDDDDDDDDVCISYQDKDVKIEDILNKKLSTLNTQQDWKVLCTALIQTHLDNECTPGFSFPIKNQKQKLQTAQNKCIRLCLGLYLALA